MSKIQNPTKVITGVNTRWSYANVWDAKSINGGAPKFSVSLIIPKSDTVTVNKIKAAIQAAYEEGESKLKGNGKFVPALDTIKTPLRDGDKERPGDDAYKGCYFINANSATAPGIVDADRNPIMDRSDGDEDFLIFTMAIVIFLYKHKDIIDIDFYLLDKFNLKDNIVNDICAFTFLAFFIPFITQVLISAKVIL